MLVEAKPIPLKKKIWEYQEFVYQHWTLDNSWISLASDDSLTLPLAVDFFWQTYRQQILTEIEQWLDDGWEYVEEPGAQGLRLSWSEAIRVGIDPSDFVLWIATLGLALVLQILAGGLRRRYVTYKPVEFRLQMRRLTHT